MPELGDLMRAAAARPYRDPDLESAYRRGRRKRLLRFSAVSVSALVTAIAVAFAATTWTSHDRELISPAEPSTQGHIVFARWTDAGSGIKTMNPDGSGIEQIVDGGPYALDDPAWSPDASRIAFHGFFGQARNEDGGLFVVNSDGSDRRLVVAPGGERPSWSPDARAISFHDDGAILIVNLETEETDVLLPNADEAEWSPEGDRIAYFDRERRMFLLFRQENGAREMPARRIDDRPAKPEWSPDGSQIALTQYTGDGPNGTITIVDADRTEVRELTTGQSPTWSPDGTRIAFERVSSDGQNSHIYSIRVDGSDLQQLTFGDVADHSPDWGPAVSDEIDADGELVRLLTEPRGFIEIGASERQACYRFEMRGVTSAHVHEEGSDAVAVELHNNIAGNYGFLGCTDGLDTSALQAIAQRPNDHFVEFHAANGGYEQANLARDAGAPDCLVTELTSPEYGLHFLTTEGRAGDRVVVWGTTLRSEDGTYAPSDRLELWWTVDGAVRTAPHRTRGDTRLASVPTSDRCYFMTSLIVPDVPRGTYGIEGRIFHERHASSYGVFPGVDFRVTASSSELPPCDADQSYGESIPGRWLKDLITELGAPGGYDVTRDEVRDTGTALRIDIPEYDNDPTIYASMLTPGEDPNIASPPPEEEVGERGDYTFYLQRGDSWQSYKAVSEDWQVSLIAYPGADNDDVAWPEGTIDWLRRAVDIAAESPPRCSGPLN